MNNHGNRVVHGENEAVEKPRAAQFRLLTAIAIIAFFGGCSLFPIISGSYKVVTPSIVIDAPTCIAQPEVVCSHESAEEIVMLQEHLATSKANTAYLVQLAGNLQATVSSYEVPKCKLSEMVEERFKDIRARQETLQENILALTQQVTDAQRQQALAFTAYSEERSTAQEGHKLVVDTLFTDLAGLRNHFESQQVHSQQLEVLNSLSHSIAREIRAFDEKVAQSQDIAGNYETLQTTVSAFVCPAAVVPAVVMPPVVECPVLELPQISSSLPEPIAIVSKPVVARTPPPPPKDCILVPEAQRLVTELVASEVQLLTQNLTVFAHQVVEESSHALSVAAGDASLHALRTFLEESAEENEKLLAEAQYHTELAQLHASNRSATTAANAKTTKTTTPAIVATSAIPELDFASFSAGSRVVAAQTSATYFPAQWRLDQHLQSALDYVGVPVDVLSTGATEGPVRKMYELLSLHKTVGVPEDALEPSTRPGACWPMQGQSGNFTINMHGSVLIESVSIDHTSGGDRASAPKDFEIYGLTESGQERLIAKGRFQVSATSESVQNFRVIDDSYRSADQPFQTVSLRILSNHGHPAFTCLYRFRVHGIPLQ